jgi:hypothetical protein
MIKKGLFGMVAASLIWSCNSTPPQAEQEADNMEPEEVVEEAPDRNVPETYEEAGLKIYPAPASPTYEGANLSLIKPENGGNTAEGAVAFEFGVENYELGAQTSDAEGKGLANSGKGQHIHLIVDNSPYSAHYMPGLEKEFEAGNHYAIAFLSRSYHESVKSEGAAQVFQFSVGETTDEAYDLTQPMLFYSRPKGEYTGTDTEKVLFDFYLHNVTLSENGMHVKLTVNGTSSFEFDTWQPYVIEGLPAGENTFDISLLDAEGNEVNMDINSTSRTFTLTP